MNQAKHTGTVNRQNTINSLPTYLRRMKLKNIGEILLRKDIRTAEKWCRDNNVTVFPDRGGKFVLVDDFEMGCKREVEMAMKKKFGDGWETILSTHDVQQAINSNHVKSTITNIGKKHIKALSTEANKFHEYLEKTS